ncbi:hypothetical protein [Bathymodiolus japonicus methanotrophic gill symbiont]|uniref:hypothetical protein n=1 Tax=Bathymodiolus japonicus methanotrophic gill symbiont TaxID=113269 RepID=UPI001C8E4285|nr:hypothetical protein [Bathymodiolus japonicus methanotrophic gill symbiont]
MATTNGSTAIRDKILASLARYRALRIGKFPCAFWRLSARPGLTAFELLYDGNNADVDLRGSFKNRSGTSAQSEGASQFRIFRYPPHHCRSGFGSGF